MFLLTDHSGGIMETPSCIKKTIKEERRRKLKEEYLEKSFDRYFERGIITYLGCRCMSRIMVKHCDSCSTGERTKSFLMDSFSMEEIDESLPFFFPESYLSDVTWCKEIKQKHIMSYLEEEN